VRLQTRPLSGCSGRWPGSTRTARRSCGRSGRSPDLEAFRVAFGLGDEAPIMRPREHRMEIW